MKKTGMKLFSVCLTLVLFIGTFASVAPLEAQHPKQYVINNPYAKVDWETFGQYKGAFHVHTTNSDGGASRAETVEDHYAKGYNILVIADHNFLTPSWDEPGYAHSPSRNRPGLEGVGMLTAERRAEIEAGVGRNNGKGMIGIPHSNEQSAVDHIITMWADFCNTSREDMAAEQKVTETLERTKSLGGLSLLSHPGRYTGGRNEDLAVGAAASNDPKKVKKYVDLFLAFPHSLLGMEIMNRLDNETRSDRILWDNILKQTMPKGKSIWGFSNDDSHGMAQTGFNFNVLLLPELTVDATRKALEAGAFYAVAHVDRRLEVNHLDRAGNAMRSGGNASVAYLYTEMTAPSIVSIVVAGNSITLNGADYDYIGWVADGVEIARGNTINLNDHSDKVNSYIRAHIVGKGGVAFTQPFGITVGTTP